ncbi:hypothetical protein NDK47_02920 [Brevibacillus ruminantium]|uniref:DUF4878 domain-containing protein n=1 Tax=Brevibacillus ruminantium TaxID=2950604 RepID=A0ABY4WJR1_9BACL|nr:hypothetical protein [Brevibacillus ruminantium]USG66302.1 hypothetical protein NDK47_02920 [Brevibacillus ruminantium]
MKKLATVGTCALLVAATLGWNYSTTRAAEDDFTGELPIERFAYDKSKKENRPISPNFLNYKSIPVRTIMGNDKDEDYEDAVRSVVASKQKDSVITSLYLNDDADEGYVLENTQEGISYVHVLKKENGDWHVDRVEKLEWKKKKRGE